MASTVFCSDRGNLVRPSGWIPLPHKNKSFGLSAAHRRDQAPSRPVSAQPFMSHSILSRADFLWTPPFYPAQPFEEPVLGYAPCVRLNEFSPSMFYLGQHFSSAIVPSAIKSSAEKKIKLSRTNSYRAAFLAAQSFLPLLATQSFLSRSLLFIQSSTT